jgi:hypothetical protein
MVILERSQRVPGKPSRGASKRRLPQEYSGKGSDLKFAIIDCRKIGTARFAVRAGGRGLAGGKWSMVGAAPDKY